jgi:imidazolonepropionase-like amidohydrolase
MKNYLRLISVLLLVSLFSLSVFAQKTSVYQFVNGNWYDGKSFKKRTFYSVNGILKSKKPQKIDETVDLKNQFVIPPFADAHTHNLDGSFNLEKLINDYLTEGTFYVQVLANYGEGAKQARPFLNKPSSLDVIYANGMLTCTYGHPFMVYEPLAMGIYSPSDAFKRVEEVKKSRRAENDAYWFFDSKQDVDAKWEKYLATKPDIVKIGLLDAENQAKYYAAGDTVNKGLSSEVAEYVVQKAHQADLKVYAHIETVNDFRLGLKIGVDGFAHLSNYGWNGKIEDKPKDDLTLADIKLAARKKVVVIPTAQIGEGRASNYDEKGNATIDQERFKRVLERQRNLHNLMIKNGVNVALGSDYFGKTLGVELWYLHDNKIFDNQTLLKIAVEKTPQGIFPNRKIGKFQDGYEASFITVAENPLQNFETLKKINLRFKQGVFIELKK